MTGPTSATNGPTPSRADGRSPWRTVVWIVVALVVLAVAASMVRVRDMGYPLSISSTSDDGTRAMVALAESFGSRVRTTDQPAPDRDGVALALGWSVDADRVPALRRWVSRGNTLVLTRPVEGVTPELTSSANQALVVERGTCDAPGFADVRALVYGGSFGPLPASFRVPQGARSCFGDGRRAFAVVEEVGSGRIVSLASPYVFTNANLDEADNAVLVVRQLVPGGEGVDVWVLEYLPGESELSLPDAIPLGVKLALAQAVVALVVYGVARGRRLGKPIVEPLPTAIAGSELVDAVGHLLARTKDPERAAAVLRAGLRRDVALRYGVPPDAEPQVLADVVSARTGLDPNRILAAVAGPGVSDDTELAQLADRIDQLRQEVVDVIPH